MTINKKIILGIITAIIIAVIGVAIIGFHLMGQKNTWDNGLDLEEVRYGDLVYFKEKVEDGDIIFRSKYYGELGQTANFNVFGIIEKSEGKIYVWDSQNTMKNNLYDWVFKGNGEHVKVFRKKDSAFNINKAELINGNYNYLMDSDKIEFVTEN
jgi:hypothetical protein